MPPPLPAMPAWTCTANVDTSLSEANRRSGAGAGSSASPFELTTQFVDSGFAVSAWGRPLAPGCQVRAADAGATVTIAKRDGGYDYAELAACASRIKSSPDAASETTARLFAPSSADIQAVVHAIDALHGDAGTLFSDVSIGIAPRAR